MIQSNALLSIEYVYTATYDLLKSLFPVFPSRTEIIPLLFSVTIPICSGPSNELLFNSKRIISPTSAVLKLLFTFGIAKGEFLICVQEAVLGNSLIPTTSLII